MSNIGNSRSFNISLSTNAAGVTFDGASCTPPLTAQNVQDAICEVNSSAGGTLQDAYDEGGAGGGGIDTSIANGPVTINDPWPTQGNRDLFTVSVGTDIKAISVFAREVGVMPGSLVRMLQYSPFGPPLPPTAFNSLVLFEPSITSEVTNSVCLSDNGAFDTLRRSMILGRQNEVDNTASDSCMFGTHNNVSGITNSFIIGHRGRLARLLQDCIALVVDPNTGTNSLPGIAYDNGDIDDPKSNVLIKQGLEYEESHVKGTYQTQYDGFGLDCGNSVYTRRFPANQDSTLTLFRFSGEEGKNTNYIVEIEVIAHDLTLGDALKFKLISSGAIQVVGGSVIWMGPGPIGSYNINHNGTQDPAGRVFVEYDQPNSPSLTGGFTVDLTAPNPGSGTASIEISNGTYDKDWYGVVTSKITLCSHNP